ncbi:MAG: ABC transporter permease [Candidatus Azobacteroides sp.]|nr:ABC transporter permease [Candidatus Azobacteroides sp.]
MKQFIRNFKKQRTVGLLNICSLSLGIMVAVIVGLWAINEMSFDKFHKNNDRIYRIITHATLNGNPAKEGSTWMVFGKQAKDELPEIEDMNRVYAEKLDLRMNDILYQSISTYATDSNFFSFFTFPLKVGDPKNVLSSPDKVVISESAAAKYFPGKDPIGQTVKTWEQDFVVSGIMKDMPRNSSLQADFIFPFYGWRIQNEWGNNDAYVTFLLLKEGVNAEAMAEPLTQLAYRNSEPIKNFGMTFTLQSLNDMHFSSDIAFDQFTKGSKSLVMTFVLTALIILIISCINFTNLFVSTSFIRAKNIGIKKTLGAKKTWLMREFYVETAWYVLISIAVGLAIATVILPVFNSFTQSQLILDFTTPQIYIFLLTLLLCVVLLAGSFPALYMTRFNVIETIKGKFKGKKMGLLQKSLVITQFTASIALLIVVAFMQKQVNYMLSYDLGFDKEHVLYIKAPNAVQKDYQSFEKEFAQEPTIKAMARKNRLPTDWSSGAPVKRVPSDNSQGILMEQVPVSPNYFDFFGMKLIAGENSWLIETEDAESNNVIINESAARLLGYKNPVGEKILLPGQNQIFTISGMVRNAYTKSLHQDVDPQVYLKLKDNWWDPYIFFKIEGDPQHAINFIGQKWKEKEGLYPFEYHFLDDTYQRLYTSETNANKVFSFAMLIAIIITVAGLFAMAYYATQRRVREIAIRKVYGASIKNVFVLLNKSFLLWVVIAFAIACPIAFYGIHKWLGGFVIKTPLSIWIFLLVGIIALLITLLTTGYQTWKAATTNPVNSIKIE